MAVASASRPRPGGGRLFIIVGVVMAVIAGGLVFFLASSVGGRGGLGGATANVVVAASDIPIRTVIGPSQVVLKQYAQADVPPGAFTKVTDVQNLIAEVNISKEQPLTSNVLAKSGTEVAGLVPAYLPIPSGYVAFTIPTSEQQGVAGYIQAGDYITVQSTMAITVFTQANPQSAPQNQGTRSVTKTVFTQVHVLRVGPATNSVSPASSTGAAPTSANGGLSSSLTVVINECDAEYLNWLNSNSNLKYVLESFKDYQPQDSQPNPTCPNVGSAKGVGPTQVDARWGFTKL